MKKQFNFKRFVVRERERFRFWNEIKRRPGESIQELATRTRQAAATCDFSSITDPSDEALRTRFIWSINNEAVLKALFKINADAAKIAKETVFRLIPECIQKVNKSKCCGCGKVGHLAPDCYFKNVAF